MGCCISKNKCEFY